jgi:hypothetical protein
VKRIVSSALFACCLLGVVAWGGSSSVTSWQRVRASLVKTGVVAERNAERSSPHADVITTDPDATPYWYVWVFRGADTREREIISGLNWRMALGGKRPGRIYWTDFVKDIGAESGSYYAITLYGSNVALVTRIDRERKVAHPASPAKMPRRWLTVDGALGRVAG